MKKSLMVSALALVASAAAAQAETLTISWWGYNGDKLNANIIEPFKQKCGCDVVFETGNNADRLGKLAARGGKGVDVIFLTDAYSQVGIENGVFAKFDRSKLTNLDKIYPIARDPQNGYGPAYTVGRIGIVYDADKVAPITSWNDLWRDDLKGKISLPSITTTAGPMFVVEAGKHAGVDAYEDPDAAFKAIEEIKPNTVKNYNTGSEMVNLASTGEMSVTMTQDFTLKSLKDAVPGMTWANLSDGDIAVLNTVNIPKGASNPELAYQFIDFLLSTEVQQKEAEQGVDAPINMDVKLSADQAKMWTYGQDQIDALNIMDYSKMNEAKTDWVDRWNEIFGM
ncbi:polyamine ABC transporter substrate-binding protein [Pseudooceanicola sp. CBS1P-1]|uniref:Extracellular solute-binding protein n=1 Tax=Pseudooceanicola albus TaxID=2692189 RepID=A0A6L7G1R9_9RHOB|nr:MULTISPECIES: ABC transporter substrate-binding protein [Pseudooceanicola]MBT9384991.1 polyamine ABC transporter substrate-binding protein [Pseudooceanicola endophyticus]MXN18015.1 extracellular solute-binding protein [Pseudooceanicola albus]